MKKYPVTLFVTLCVSSLAFAQIAMGDVTVPASQPAAAAAVNAAASTNAASASRSLKEIWPASEGPSHRLKANGVPNFGKLNDNIWRSGQPSREGYARLAKEGLKTVVNLREEFPQDKELVPDGVRYVYIPIKDERAPTDEQAKQFMEVASDPANWPLLVHCHGGEGRAGVMSGLVRSSLDGWDHNKVMKEVGNFRLKFLGLFSKPMQACQQQFLLHWESLKDPNQKAQDTPNSGETATEKKGS